jgi:hypothetical protein
MFDLPHLGAEIAEGHRCPRPGQDARKIEDTNTVERSAHAAARRIEKVTAVPFAGAWGRSCPGEAVRRLSRVPVGGRSMQFVSTLLEICVGLISVYIALSLFVSWANEQVATVANLRANGLAAGIEKMLGSPELRAGLFAHPAIGSASANSTRRPQYLSASQFSTALLAIIDVTPAINTTAEAAFTNLQADVAALGPGPLKTALTSFLNRSAGDYNMTVALIENWFDTTMSGVSAIYRRYATIITFAIGTIVVVALDVDSVRLFQQFQCNSSVRASVAGAATTAATNAQADAAFRQISSAVFSSLKFSWLWSGSDAGPVCPQAAGSTYHEPSAGLYWLLKVAGWLTTIVAVSLGAPFWFDTLKLVMNGKSTLPASATAS